MMIKQRLEQDLKKAVEELEFPSTDIVCSIPEKLGFGDYTTNIPLQLANQKSSKSYHSPKEIANAILDKLGDKDYLDKVEVAGPGFLNFFINQHFLVKDLSEILEQSDQFGKNSSIKNQKIQVEFISANPTGPLTLANGRGGAIGDTLSNVLTHSGALVEREYYINDTGNQIRLLGESVLASLGKVEKKEEHYQGLYIRDLAQKFSDKADLPPQELGHLLADYLIDNEIKPAISKLGIKFDRFYSERTLYPEKIEAAVELLKHKGATYEKEGALYFKSTEYGDDKDRVLLTSSEKRGLPEPTYFLADIAHHLDIYQEHFEKRINILGADHHSYITRIQAAVGALGHKGKLMIIVMQLVKLFKNGYEVRMSKRAGNFVTLDELLEQVSPDVIRFFFLMHSPSTHIDFDLDLAKEQSNKNPVYYVQYAHARMASLLTKAQFEQQSANLELLKDKSELDLIKHLLSFPEVVLKVSKDYSVNQLPTFSLTLADLFHKFYERCPVLNADNESLKLARLQLVKASQIVLRNALALMGISAPEKM